MTDISYNSTRTAQSVFFQLLLVSPIGITSISEIEYTDSYNKVQTVISSDDDIRNVFRPLEANIHLELRTSASDIVLGFVSKILENN